MVETRRDYCVNIFPSGNNFSCSFYNVPFTLNPHSPMSSAFSHPFSNLPSSACKSFLPLHPRWLLLLPFSAIISPAQPRFLAQIRACRYGRVDIIFEEAFSTKLQPICARVCSLTPCCSARRHSCLGQRQCVVVERARATAAARPVLLRISQRPITSSRCSTHVSMICPSRHMPCSCTWGFHSPASKAGCSRTSSTSR